MPTEPQPPTLSEAEALHHAFHDTWSLPDPLDLYVTSPIWQAMADTLAAARHEQATREADRRVAEVVAAVEAVLHDKWEYDEVDDRWVREDDLYEALAPFRSEVTGAGAMGELRIGSLCSGYGGLDMAVEAVYGGALAWVSDIDKGACALLAHRHPGVPNIGDFTKTDWSTHEPVDIITAGFPCQPVSGAGKGLGDEDERWLWDEVHRAIREVRPGVVVLENVRGLVSKFGGRLFARVLGSLADVGYDARWHGLKASDVGAPHGRWRIFIVATDAQRRGRDGWARAPRGRAVGRVAADWHPQGALLPTPAAYDAERGGPQHPAKRRAGGHSVSLQDALHGLTLLPTPAVNDMGEGKTVDAWDEWTAKMKARHNNGNGHGKSLAIELQRVESGWGPYTLAVERWERIVGREAPPPDEPVLVREWMMGLPLGWVTDVPDLSRKEKVKLAGNGVVPQQAAEALRVMAAWERAA